MLHWQAFLSQPSDYCSVCKCYCLSNHRQKAIGLHLSCSQSSSPATYRQSFNINCASSLHGSHSFTHCSKCVMTWAPVKSPEIKNKSVSDLSANLPFWSSCLEHSQVIFSLTQIHISVRLQYKTFQGTTQIVSVYISILNCS